MCKKHMLGIKYFAFLFKIDIITMIYATLTLQFYERKQGRMSWEKKCSCPFFFAISAK